MTLPHGNRGSTRWHGAVALTAALGSLFLYLSGMARGLSFAFGGSDGGELAVAVQTLGIPHPTGYPTYVLLAQAFRALPWRDLAARLNLFSACCAALSVGASSAIARSLLQEEISEARAQAPPLWPRIVGGATAGAYLAVAGLFWQEALRAEVYTLHTALASLSLLLLLRPSRGTSVVAGFLLGLGLGNHATMAFYGLGAVAFLLLKPERPRRKEWLQVACGVALGLSVYLYLPLRARADPWLNWGNPVDLASLWAHVTGAAYRTLLLRVAPGEMLGRLSAAARLLLHDFAPWGAILGALGVVHLWKQKRAALMLITVPGVLGLLLALGYGGERSEVHLLSLYLMWATCCGIGAGLLTERMGKSWRSSIALTWVFPALALPLAALRGPVLSLREDPGPLPTLRPVLQSLPSGAIVLTARDEETFALWYLQAVEKVGTETAVVDARLLSWSWYRQEIPARYPGVLAPGEGARDDLLASFLLENGDHPAYAFASVQPLPGFRRESTGPLYRLTHPGVRHRRKSR
ncbi:MAG: protein O-mannosyl-transferase family [Chloroflexia bacterium]